MKMEDKANLPRVRIAVLGHVNVGKSGELFFVNWKIEKSAGAYDVHLAETL